MRALSPKARLRLAALLAAGCSVLFAFQFSWLAALIIHKWGSLRFSRPDRAMEIQTDVLFFSSVVLSLVATAINDWGWHTLRDFLRRLPAAGTLVVVLAIAVGGKIQATAESSSGHDLVPWFDMVQSTIWLLLLGGGVRIWHRRNGNGKSSPLSRRLRWVILLKIVLLCLLWLYQCSQLLRGEGMPPWGVCFMDVLYFVGMVAAWFSYMERNAAALWRGIAGVDEVPDTHRSGDEGASGGDTAHGHDAG